MAGKHAKLSASSAYRWMNCAGSINLIAERGADTTNEYAAEGTAAHEVAADGLSYSCKAADFIGKKIKADGYTFTVDEEMAEAVQVYLDKVHGDMERGAVGWVELSLTSVLQELHPEFGGTADRVTYYPLKKWLRVYDYKHGAGVPVNVHNNTQLKYYALGALLAVEDPVDWVEITIVQPRCDHEDGPVRTADPIAAVDLIDFAADLLEAARATEDSWAPLKSGDWCKFCPAAHACPELENHQNALMVQEFDVLENLPAEKLVQALEVLPMVEARIKAIRERAYREAMHGGLPGYKIVEKRATRKWINEEEAAARVMEDEFRADLFAPQKLKSPAQVEKLLGESNFKELEDELVEKKSSGYNLVPDSDPKPAAMLASTDDFDEVK